MNAVQESSNYSGMESGKLNEGLPLFRFYELIFNVPRFREKDAALHVSFIKTNSET